MLCVARHQPAICESRSRASVFRSTATARLWQRKGRCIRVKLACKMTRGPPRLHSPAFSRPSGVNRDTRRPLGTRRDACGCRRDICVCLIKTGFDRSVGGAVWALTADPCPREAAAILLDYFTQRAFPSLRLRRGETAGQSLCCPRSESSTVAALHARASTPQREALLPRYTRARRPWARKKRKMTSPRPST